MEISLTSLPPDLIQRMDAYWRTANYLSVGKIYLFDNPLLKRPFRLVMDTVDRVPHTGERRIVLKQRLHEKLIEHGAFIRQFGQDMPEIRIWKWNPRIGPA